LLCHLGHLCVPLIKHEKDDLEAHYCRVVGHFGVENTMVVLQNYFFSLRIRRDVNNYIRSCILVPLPNPPLKNHGLYTPLPTPDRPWESISMDYMFGLTSTKHGNDYVFVVIDRFSKMAILTSCKKSITVRGQC
jgi:hypothetical protein